MAIPASTRTQLGAIADGDLRNEVFAEAFMSQLLSATKLVGMCNRTFEERMRNANSVRYYIDKTILSVRDQAAPTSGNVGVIAWRTGNSRNTFSLEAKQLVWGRNLTIDIDIPITDISELSVPMLVQAADDRARKVAVVLDDYILSQWKAVNLSKVGQGYDPAQTSSDEKTLDQTDDLGAAANYIKTDGTLVGALSLLTYLKQLKLRLKQSDKAGDVAQSPVEMWTVAMPPHLYYAISEELEDLDNVEGVFAVEVINGIERKRLYGIFEIVESNTLFTAESVSGKAYYPIYLSTPQATTFGMRNETRQELTPADNVFGPYYKRDEYFEYYGEVQDPRFLYEIRVRSEA